MTLHRALLTAFVAAIISSHTHAQIYPIKPIRLVVPFAAGGPTDILARAIGQRLTEVWKQQVIVDNRAGAAGSIGAELVARSAPDGYTLLVSSNGVLTVNPGLFKKLSYDPVRDFAPIAMATTVTNILVVHPSLPVRTVRDLIQLAKSRPGELRYASAGYGSASHLSTELFKSVASVDITHIPYKGAHPGVIDLVTGQVHLMLIGLPAAMPQIRNGRLRAIAVANRSVALPDLPTIAESGLPGFTVVNWLGILAPAGTPREVIARLNSEIVKAVHLPDVKARLATEGFEPIGSTPERFAEEIRTWIPKWAEVIKRAGIKPE